MVRPVWLAETVLVPLVNVPPPSAALTVMLGCDAPSGSCGQDRDPMVLGPGAAQHRAQRAHAGFRRLYGERFFEWSKAHPEDGAAGDPRSPNQFLGEVWSD